MKSYFLEKLLTTERIEEPLEDYTIDSQKDLQPSEEQYVIILSPEEKPWIYQSWKLSVIIKLFGKRIAHQYFKQKILQLWKPTEDFPLIDLGEDFYIVEFLKEENMSRASHNGPWFIDGFFL